MKGTGVDVIGLDWTVDMADGRKRLGTDISVQGNVDPAYLFSTLPALSEEIQRFVIELPAFFLVHGIPTISVPGEFSSCYLPTYVTFFKEEPYKLCDKIMVTS